MSLFTCFTPLFSCSLSTLFIRIYGYGYGSTASVPITVLLYDGPLLCGFNVAIKGLTD